MIPVAVPISEGGPGGAGAAPPATSRWFYGSSRLSAAVPLHDAVESLARRPYLPDVKADSAFAIRYINQGIATDVDPVVALRVELIGLN